MTYVVSKRVILFSDVMAAGLSWTRRKLDACWHNVQDNQGQKDWLASTKRDNKIQFFRTSRVRNCVLL